MAHPKTKEKALAMLREGKRAVDVARSLQLAPGTVRSWAAGAGIKPPPPRKSPNTSQPTTPPVRKVTPPRAKPEPPRGGGGFDAAYKAALRSKGLLPESEPPPKEEEAPADPDADPEEEAAAPEGKEGPIPVTAQILPGARSGTALVMVSNMFIRIAVTRQVAALDVSSQVAEDLIQRHGHLSDAEKAELMQTAPAAEEAIRPYIGALLPWIGPLLFVESYSAISTRHTLRVRTEGGRTKHAAQEPRPEGKAPKKSYELFGRRPASEKPAANGGQHAAPEAPAESEASFPSASEWVQSKGLAPPGMI